MNNIRVCFVNPPHADWCLANNAAYLMFQSHYKRFGKNIDKVSFTPAPYKFNAYKSVQEILDEIGQNEIYLFSSYVWNYEICDELAALIKETYPTSICVLGGPQVGVHDNKFFLTRSMYDYILTPTKPGEVFVQELIDSYFEYSGYPDVEDLSWELRSKKTCDQFMPDYSVYEEHLDYLTETRNYSRQHSMEPFCIIETTRGCPYACVYCEWGGGIDSKIYKKPIEIVKRDLLALKQAGFRDVYLTDANFGAFKDRDIEIFKFAWENGVNCTDISTMKSKDLKRRIELVDAWFAVVGSGPERHSPVMSKEGGQALVAGMDDVSKLEFEEEYVSIVPTVSIQSISDEAMKVAKRADLSYENKIKLSEHIRKRCHEEGFPVPAIELIMGMPGSTLQDFYDEWEIMWNFKAWTSYRHDYMFLPDTDLAEPDYLKKYDIKTAEVYSDLVDEWGVDNQNSLYKNKRTHFKTISSCYSFSFDDMCEMWLMNLAENKLLQEVYPMFEDSMTAPDFGKRCYDIIKELDEFKDIIKQIRNILDPNTPPQNIKRLDGKLRNIVINDLLDLYKPIITSELYGYSKVS
jgi:radical SAM superfamily enzyme YgiQ (UPF0313 family)